jgi:hypothetical protein
VGPEAPRLAAGRLTRKIGAVDVDFLDRAEVFDFWPHQVSGVSLRFVGGSDCGCQDETVLQIADYVSLVAIERFRLGLAAMTHVRVGHRDASVLGHAAPDAHSSVWVGLEILGNDALYQREGFF